jgi:hypothetical protein
MKPTDRKKSLVRKWGLTNKRTSHDIAAVAAGGEESSSAFEDFYRVRAAPVHHASVDNTIRSNRGLSHCIAEGGADVDVYLFQAALERYFYRCELGLQIVRVTLLVLIVILLLSLSHYGFQLTRCGLSVLDDWVCESPPVFHHPRVPYQGDPSSANVTAHCGQHDKNAEELNQDPQYMSTLDGFVCKIRGHLLDNGAVDVHPPLAPQHDKAAPFCATWPVHYILFYIEYNPALLATTLFARPIVQVVLVGLIVAVSRGKRLSRLEPPRATVERMNEEVLQPVMGLKYDIDSNLLLVQTTD